jgi:hypothetical protein
MRVVNRWPSLNVTGTGSPAARLDTSLDDWFDPAEPPPPDVMEHFAAQELLDPDMALEGQLVIWRWTKAIRRRNQAIHEWREANAEDYIRVAYGRSRPEKPLVLPPRTSSRVGCWWKATTLTGKRREPASGDGLWSAV